MLFAPSSREIEFSKEFFLKIAILTSRLVKGLSPWIFIFMSYMIYDRESTKVVLSNGNVSALGTRAISSEPRGRKQNMRRLRAVYKSRTAYLAA